MPFDIDKWAAKYTAAQQVADVADTARKDYLAAAYAAVDTRQVTRAQLARAAGLSRQRTAQWIVHIRELIKTSPEWADLVEQKKQEMK